MKYLFTKTEATKLNTLLDETRAFIESLPKRMGPEERKIKRQLRKTYNALIDIYNSGEVVNRSENNL
jgi:hypothetical protein